MNSVLDVVKGFSKGKIFIVGVFLCEVMEGLVMEKWVECLEVLGVVIVDVFGGFLEIFVVKDEVWEVVLGCYYI